MSYSGFGKESGPSLPPKSQPLFGHTTSTNPSPSSPSPSPSLSVGQNVFYRDLDAPAAPEKPAGIATLAASRDSPTGVTARVSRSQNPDKTRSPPVSYASVYVHKHPGQAVARSPSNLPTDEHNQLHHLKSQSPPLFPVNYQSVGSFRPSTAVQLYQSTDLGIKKIMENNFEDRLLSTFSRMLEILEKYSDYGSPKKFVEEKKNSELQSARKDVVKEEIEDVDSDEQEEVEDETEVGEIANGEAVMKWENEVANKVFCVEAGIMEEQKSHPNKIKVENQEKPAHVLGSSKEEINGDYTWDQFFQGGFAFEAEQWRSALFFTMAMIDEVEDSSHSNWVLIRVYKAHCGRSPILDWKGKLVGLYGKLLQSPSKKARMWSSTSNKTILISSNPTARIVQLMWVEDAQNSADCFSINEPYRVPCLVLAALGFENWKRANWKVLLEGYSKSTQLWYLLIHVIKLLCFLWYFHEVLHLLDTEFEKGHSSIEKECIFMVLFFAFLEVYAVKLEFSCASSITHCEELKWLQILNILFSQYDPKEGISESIGIFPVVSHHSSLENFCVVEDEKYVATKTMTWDFVANGFSTGEWFQTDIIHQRLSASYYNVIREVLKFLEEFLRLFEHSNSIGAKREKWEVRLGNADLDDLSFLVVQALKLLCFLSYIQEVFYFLVTKAEKDGQLTIENKVIGNSLLSDLLGARLMDRKGLSWFLPLPMSKPNKSDVGNFHGAHDCVPAAMAIKRTTVVEMPLIATSCQYCCVRFCILCVHMIEEMLILVMVAKIVITTISDLAHICIQIVYIKKQKLILTFTYHLEDKVAIHGGGNDGIWEIIMCGENHVSEGYLWYFICVNYRERILYKRGSCCEK